MELTKSECKFCNFHNPKGCVAGLIIHEGKVLMIKRNEEPYRGLWDFPGGYMNYMETPEQTIRREIKEELNLEGEFTLIKPFPGTGEYEGETFATLNFAYLIEPKGEIKLNDENSEHVWIPLMDIQDVVWDSNRDILEWAKNHFNFDLKRVKELVKQLDSAATVNEFSLYKAVLNGYVSQEFDDSGKLLGMGWIFPRQTMLRKQAVVEDMIVDQEQRGKGLGGKILNDLLDWAKKQGVEVVELTSGWHREAAHALYKKNGFEIHDTAHMLKKL